MLTPWLQVPTPASCRTPSTSSTHSSTSRMSSYSRDNPNNYSQCFGYHWAGSGSTSETLIWIRVPRKNRDKLAYGSETLIIYMYIFIFGQLLDYQTILTKQKSDQDKKKSFLFKSINISKKISDPCRIWIRFFSKARSRIRLKMGLIHNSAVNNPSKSSNKYVSYLIYQ